MHYHLDELEMLGLIAVEKRNEGSTGGQYKTIELVQNLTAVLDALDETIESVGVHRAVRSTLNS